MVHCVLYAYLAGCSALRFVVFPYIRRSVTPVHPVVQTTNTMELIYGMGVTSTILTGCYDWGTGILTFKVIMAIKY